MSDLRAWFSVFSVLVFPWFWLFACTSVACVEFFTGEKRHLGSGLLDTALVKQIQILLMLSEKQITNKSNICTTIYTKCWTVLSSVKFFDEFFDEDLLDIHNFQRSLMFGNKLIL